MSLLLLMLLLALSYSQQAKVFEIWSHGLSCTFHLIIHLASYKSFLCASTPRFTLCLRVFHVHLCLGKGLVMCIYAQLYTLQLLGSVCRIIVCVNLYTLLQWLAMCIRLHFQPLPTDQESLQIVTLCPTSHASDSYCTFSYSR